MHLILYVNRIHQIFVLFLALLILIVYALLYWLCFKTWNTLENNYIAILTSDVMNCPFLKLSKDMHILRKKEEFNLLMSIWNKRRELIWTKMDLWCQLSKTILVTMEYTTVMNWKYATLILQRLVITGYTLDMKRMIISIAFTHSCFYGYY